MANLTYGTVDSPVGTLLLAAVGAFGRDVQIGRASWRESVF